MVEYIDPAIAKAQQQALEDENAKLKAELDKLKTAAKEDKPVAKKVKK